MPLWRLVLDIGEGTNCVVFHVNCSGGGATARTVSPVMGTFQPEACGVAKRCRRMFFGPGGVGAVGEVTFTGVGGGEVSPSL